MPTKLWNKDFILLLQANAVSAIGDIMYGVAIGFWVYEKTGSSALMGFMSAISMFVSMFLSPFSGSIVDKLDRKWVIVGVDVIQGVLMLTMGILAYLDRLNVVGVLFVAFIAAFGSVFYSPAISTLSIDLIPHDDMVRGQSMTSGIMSLINLVGTGFSGAMVAFFGVPLIVILNGLSNLYSALSECFVRVPRSAQQGEQVTVQGILRDTKTAVTDIFSDRSLKVFVPSALIINLLGAGPLSLMLPFCLEKGFSVDSYGYLMSVYTLASLACVLILGVVKLSPKVRFWVMALGFCLGVPFTASAFLVTEFLPMAALVFMGAVLNSAGNAVFNASLMLALPEENRGAILGFIQSASVGGVALSSVIYGVLGDLFPLYLVFAAGTLLSLGPMIYMCFHPGTKEFVLEN